MASQLGSLQAAVEKLHRLNAAKEREQEESRLRTELRLQQLEQRQSSMEAHISSLDQRIGDLEQGILEEIDEIRTSTRSMMSQVVGQIADQFDAVQAALDSAYKRHESDILAQKSSFTSLEKRMSEFTQQQEVVNSSLRQEFEDELRKEVETSSAAAALKTEEVVDALEHRMRDAHQEAMQAMHKRLDSNASELTQLQDRVKDLDRRQVEHVEEQKAALRKELDAVDNHHRKASKQLEEALTLWQDGLEEKVKELDHSLDQYKQYVRRLRSDVRGIKTENDSTAQTLIQAIKRELNENLSSSLTFERDLAALIGQFHDD